MKNIPSACDEKGLSVISVCGGQQNRLLCPSFGIVIATVRYSAACEVLTPLQNRNWIKNPRAKIVYKKNKRQNSKQERRVR